MKVLDTQKSIENNVQTSVYLSLKNQMITKSIITFHLSPPKVTTLLILVLISPTHNYVFLLYLYVSLNNIDLSFAGFKILCRWYFTIYVFCFSLFFLLLFGIMLLWLIQVGICVLVNSFLPFYKRAQFNYSFSNWRTFRWFFYYEPCCNEYPWICLFVSKNKPRSASPALLDIANLLSKISQVVLIYTPTIRYKISHCSTSLPTFGVARLFNVCQSDRCEMISHYGLICIYLISDEVENF